MEPLVFTRYSLWLLLYSILLQPCPSRSCFEHERAALLQLKSYFISVAPPTYSDLLWVLSSWDSNVNSNCCLWNNVDCDNSMHHVTHLDLPYITDLESLDGPVKTSVALNFSLFEAFGELISLDLSSNGITGFLGNGEFSTLKKLEELHLSDNNVNGSIPSQDLAHLKELRVLDLGINALNGSLHGEGICNLRKLEDLSLGLNAFSGSLPNCLCNFTSLQNLDLSDNSFSGRLPKCLWNMTSLQYLDLSENSFSGELPPHINLPLLQSLTISNNNFQGRVSFCHLMNYSRLETLDLSNNALRVEFGDSLLCSRTVTGYSFNLQQLYLGQCRLGMGGQSNTFLMFLSNQSILEYLDLSSNGLGRLPPKWLGCRALSLRNNSITGSLELPYNVSLSILDVSNNKFTGEIPGHIGMVFDIYSFINMSHNYFQGHIPSSIGDIANLRSLDLSNNQLVGAVPRNLFSCDLELLLLSNNHLQGDIIPSYMNLSSLEVLCLDNNNFTGTIKGSLNTSQQLHMLDISNNKATGELPIWIGDLQALKSMSLARNGFYGDIPSQISKLSSLELLDVSENGFTGGLPSSCGRLRQLKFLNMHGNSLTGSIPGGLASLSSLVTLDLSNNHLSGGIPTWIDQLSNLVILLLWGNQLRGELPNQLCRLKHVNIINLSNNEISGFIPTCFTNLSFGIAQLATTFVTDYSRHYTTGNQVYTREEEVAVLIVKSTYCSYGGNILSLMSELDLSANKLSGEIPPELGDLGKIHALNMSHNHLAGSIPRSFSKLKSIESLDLSNNNLSGRIPSELVDLTFLEIFNVSYNNLSGEVPEIGGQFGTFDERTYLGNPLLCGSRLPRSCKTAESELTENAKIGEEDEGFDMVVFLWSFGMSSVTIFLALNVILAINPYWRRAWFAFVDVKLLWWFHY